MRNFNRHTGPKPTFREFYAARSSATSAAGGAISFPRRFQRAAQLFELSVQPTRFECASRAALSSRRFPQPAGPAVLRSRGRSWAAAMLALEGRTPISAFSDSSSGKRSGSRRFSAGSVGEKRMQGVSLVGKWVSVVFTIHQKRGIHENSAAAQKK